jgi:hypothetical protein
MSRTYEALSEKQQSEQQEKEQQQKTELMTTTASEDYLAELARFRDTAADNSRVSFFGKIMRFRKGEWLLGQEKEKVPDRSRWIAIMAEARHGWIKWTTVTLEDGTPKRVPVHTIGKIVDGYQPPARPLLGDMDQSKWKLGLNDKPEDPLKKVVYLPLLSQNGEKVMTFTTNTPTGLPRFWQLMEKYAWIGKKHLGQYPIIELRASGYDDRRYGWVQVPDFEIVGWVGRPDPTLLLGHANDGGGDGSEEPPPYETIPEEYVDQE